MNLQERTNLTDAQLDDLLDRATSDVQSNLVETTTDLLNELSSLAQEKARRMSLDRVWEVPVVVLVEADTYEDAVDLVGEVIDGLDYEEYTKPFQIEVATSLTENSDGSRTLRLRSLDNPMLVRGSSFA